MTESILIVDDNDAERLLLAAMLEKLGYAVVTTSNGFDALQMQTEQPVMLIVSDWMMPGMTGLDLCEKMQGQFGDRGPYFILLTAYNDPSKLVAGLSAGADDFVSKPFSVEELRVRIEAGMRVVRLRAELENRNARLAAAAAREAESLAHIRADLDVAARMQRELLPSQSLGMLGLDFGLSFRAASTVAGDGANISRLDANHVSFYVFDVAGHGIASAMVSFAVSSFMAAELATAAQHCAEDTFEVRAIDAPESVVKTLNERFGVTDDCTRYFTMVYGVLNTSTGAGRLCQAGHPHPLILRSSGVVESLGRGGLPVGMFNDAMFEGIDFELDVGEVLVICSDGIHECTNVAGEQFGHRRLHAALRGSAPTPQALVDAIDDAVSAWRGTVSLDDDCTLLAMRR